MTAGRAYTLALAVMLGDQLLKAWVVFGLRLAERDHVPVLPFFSWTWVENRGVSMGLLAADAGWARWGLVALTAGIAAAVAWWIRREEGPWERLGLGLVLGGAIGNIIDRVRLGYVIDFVHLHAGRWSFYVFNVADAAITAGVLLLLWRTLAAPGAERVKS